MFVSSSHFGTLGGETKVRQCEEITVPGKNSTANLSASREHPALVPGQG